jgi:serine/threonine protein kinase
MDRVFPLEIAVEVLADVIRGLEYLHGKSYLHRDIKTQNILVKK